MQENITVRFWVNADLSLNDPERTLPSSGFLEWKINAERYLVTGEI